MLRASLLLLFVLLLLPAARVEAATYVVSASGNDSTGSGSSGNPWKTIQKAENSVVPGDTVQVLPGLYPGNTVFNAGGTASQGITFLCTVKDLCVIDGGTTVTGWTQIATGVFEKPNSAFGFGGPIPAHVTMGDKMLVFVSTESNPPIDYMAQSSSSQEWDGIEGACVPFGSATRCRFRDNASPDTKNLKFAPKQIGAFRITGSAAAYLTIDGFYFRNAFSCIIIDTFAHHITLQNNTFTNGHYSVQVLTGAHDTHMESNHWHLNWVYADHGFPRYDTVAVPNPIQDNIFLALRRGMEISTSLYFVDAGDNHRVLNNHFDHTAAAGIYLWSTQYHAHPGYTNANIEIGYNRFNNCQDYCIQVQETDAANLRIHHNSFLHYYNGNRFGTVKNGSGTAYYVDHNTYSNPLGCNLGCGRGGDFEISAVNNLEAGVLPNGMKAYFSHNSFNSRDSAVLMYTAAQNATGLFFVNNVFSSARIFVMEAAPKPSYWGENWNGWSNNSPTTPPSWTSAPQIWAGVPTRMWPDNETAYALPAGNASINAGVNLSASWTAGNAGSQPALLGMTPNYWNGTAPDYGAVESGSIVPPPEAPSKLLGQITMRGRVIIR